MVMLIAVVLTETFPGHRPVPPPTPATAETRTPLALARDAVPAVCREGRHPLLDAGGLTVAC
ncbi:MAG TPA: hypothetical protein VEI03_06520 [Stellaceae bacterium]|nr:hypothetical protein [Stellaceae bacterium]